MHTPPPLWFQSFRLIRRFSISESLTEGSSQVSVKYETPALLFLASKQISSIFGSRLCTLQCKQCKPLEAKGLKESTLRRSVWGTWLSSHSEFSSSPRNAADSIDWSSVTLSHKEIQLCPSSHSAGPRPQMVEWPPPSTWPALVPASLFSLCLTPTLPGTALSKHGLVGVA